MPSIYHAFKGKTSMEQFSQPNPLKQYFRTFKSYIRLPSGTSYYKPETVAFTDKGEIGIMPMTGRDELAFRNPDSLLNGEAMIEVITSCVPAVKQPRQLLVNDIDALITAIRQATYNDSLETLINCPKCAEENTFKLNLGYALDHMTELDEEYVIHLDTGASVFIRPYAFPEILKSLHSEFEQTKIVRAAENPNMTDDQRTVLFNESFKKLATTKFELITDVILKVVDESQNINVTNRAHILEFVKNIDKNSADKISDMIDTINKIGIKKTFTASCSKCKHEWESDIDFNPVNFS